MAKAKKSMGGLVNIEVFIGGAPLLEPRLVAGLLQFGQSHPQWRFAVRGADFCYTREWLRKQRIAGAIVSIEAKSVAMTLRSAGIPWVHLLPSKPVRHPFADVDNCAIGRLGAEFLLEKGFSRLAFCGVGTYWSGKRAKGFAGRLAEAGLSCMVTDIPFEDGQDWGLSLNDIPRLVRWATHLEKGTAVMVAHDALANRLVDLCLRQGRRIPEDIAILSVGNHDLLCQLSPVPISSIDAAVPQVAIEGARLLESLLNGEERPNSILIPPTGVQERRSTEVLGYEDEMVSRIVAYIRDHVCEGLAVDDLLEIFPVSRRTLMRRFIKHVGHAPGAEIRRSRLFHARRMLANTRLSLAQVAATCGYADLPHMYRAFKSILGLLPGKLRIQAKGCS